MTKYSPLSAALAAPLLFVFVACSSGADDETIADAALGENSEALGEASCRTAPPDVSFDREIGSYVSEAGYSNPRCYKALVAHVSNWIHPLGDVVITDAHVNAHSAVPAKPAANQASNHGGFKDPPLLATIPKKPILLDPNEPFWMPPVSQASCESHWMAATVSSDHPTFAPVTRSAYGVWTPLAGALGGGRCTLPSLVFGGSTWREGDYQNYGRGGGFRIVVSYRSSNSSSAQTLPIRLSSLAPTCGEPGLSCCDGTNYSICGIRGICDANSCRDCGTEGLRSCNGLPSGTNGGCFPEDHALKNINGTCTRCGSRGEDCCEQGSTLCGNGLVCSDSRCVDKPAPVTPVTPPTQPVPPQDPADCGNEGKACCTQSGVPCKLLQTCNSGICGNLGPPQDNCQEWATVYIDTCYNQAGGISELPPITSGSGCGVTHEDAILAAQLGILVQSGVVLTEYPVAGACTYLAR